MYTVKIFMKCPHVCAAQTTYEIAEPRPDMNIKVADFIVRKSLLIPKNIHL